MAATSAEDESDPDAAARIQPAETARDLPRRRRSFLRELPVIVVTALPQGEADRRVAGLGVVAVLVKSRFSRKDLLVYIQRALSRPAA